MQNPAKQLLMLGGFTIGFAGALGLLTNARRQDVFAATAAYVLSTCRFEYEIADHLLVTLLFLSFLLVAAFQVLPLLAATHLKARQAHRRASSHRLLRLQVRRQSPLPSFHIPNQHL